MAKIKWTVQAAEDMESIVDFIAQDSTHYACLFAIDIFESLNHIARFPLSGRIVPEARNPIIRELILGNYRLVYRFRKDLIEILTLYHSARIFNINKLE